MIIVPNEKYLDCLYLQGVKMGNSALAMNLDSYQFA